MSGNAGAAAPRNGLAAGRTVKSAGNRQNIVERASGGGKAQGIVVDPRCDRGGAPTEAYRPPRDRGGSPLLPWSPLRLYCMLHLGLDIFEAKAAVLVFTFLQYCIIIIIKFCWVGYTVLCSTGYFYPVT